MYYFPAVYTPDMCVLVPSVLALVLEHRLDVRRLEGRSTRVLARIQAVVLLWALLTDWFAFLVLFALVLKRIWFRQFGRTRPEFIAGVVTFSAPMAVAGMVIVTILAFSSSVYVLVDKFISHTGLYEGVNVSTFKQKFWSEYIPTGLGAAAPLLLWMTLAAALVGLAVFWWRRRRETLALWAPGAQLLWVNLLLIVPGFVHCYLLRDHCGENNYSALKYAIPLSCSTFTLLPVFLLGLYGRPEHVKRQVAAGGASLVLALVYLGLVSGPDYGISMFSPPTDKYERLAACTRATVRDDEYLVQDGVLQEEHGGEEGIKSATYAKQMIWPFYAFYRLPVVFDDFFATPTAVLVVPASPRERDALLESRATEVWTCDDFKLMRFNFKVLLDLSTQLFDKQAQAATTP